MKLRTASLLATLAVTACAAQPAAMIIELKPGSISPPSPDEKMVATPPANFKLDFTHREGAIVMLEYVPQAESVADWTAMVTYQTFSDPAHRVPLGKLTADTANNFMAACGTWDAKEIEKGAVNGYAFVIWRLVCPYNPKTGKAENVHIKEIRGVENLFVAQYAFRANPSAETDATALDFVRNIGACHTRKPGHPCS
jgi:hypothetical protein